MLDLSGAGLSIRTKLDIARGDEVELLIEPAIQFQAIAWRTKRTQSGFIIGMMLSNVCPAYEGLMERHAVRRPEATATAHPAQATAPPPPPAELWWRLRVKDCDGNRTRVVAIVAASREEAIAAGRSPRSAEAGRSWKRESPRAHRRPRR